MNILNDEQLRLAGLELVNENVHFESPYKVRFQSYMHSQYHKRFSDRERLLGDFCRSLKFKIKMFNNTRYYFKLSVPLLFFYDVKLCLSIIIITCINVYVLFQFYINMLVAAAEEWQGKGCLMYIFCSKK